MERRINFVNWTSSFRLLRGGGGKKVAHLSVVLWKYKQVKSLSGADERPQTALYAHTCPATAYTFNCV